LPAVSEAADLLAQVIDQDVEVDGGRLAIRDEVARDRVVSHSDPEMRHRRKSASRRFDGHKTDLINDEDSELVLGIDVRVTNAGDGDGTVPLLEQVQKLPGVEAETLLGDMASSDGDVREAVEAKGVDLVAKVPPVTNRGRFPKSDFIIDDENKQVTCAAGNTTSTSRQVKDHKGRPATAYTFDPTICANCPMRDLCSTSKNRRRIRPPPRPHRGQGRRTSRTLRSPEKGSRPG
jgi:Transposase DDE domain